MIPQISGARATKRAFYPPKSGHHMAHNRLYSLAAYLLIPIWLISVVWSGSDSIGEVIEKASVMVEEEPEGDGLVDRASLTMTALPKPPVEFWDELARCETNSDWQNGGRFGGGLGIMNNGTFAKGVLGGQMGTWERWGGEEFAPSPQEATKEQQIIVANRVALWGWEVTVDRGQEFAERHGVSRMYHYVKDPVGFNGWGALGCAGGRPKRLYYYDNPTELVKVEFSWMEQSVAVSDLQNVLGMKKITGVYNHRTREKHLAALNYWGLSTAGVPDIPVDIAAVIEKVGSVVFWDSE